MPPPPPVIEANEKNDLFHLFLTMIGLMRKKYVRDRLWDADKRLKIMRLLRQLSDHLGTIFFFNIIHEFFFFRYPARVANVISE